MLILLSRKPKTKPKNMKTKSEIEVNKANLIGKNLSGANLSKADLSGANLLGANLGESNLLGADLRGANLYGANLYGANLYEANLYEANLSRSNGIKFAQCSFSRHGECGRMLTCVEIDGQIMFFCGCFKGNEEELRSYIEKEKPELKESRLFAMEFVIKAIAI